MSDPLLPPQDGTAASPHPHPDPVATSHTDGGTAPARNTGRTGLFAALGVVVALVAVVAFVMSRDGGDNPSEPSAADAAATGKTDPEASRDDTALADPASDGDVSGSVDGTGATTPTPQSESTGDAPASDNDSDGSAPDGQTTPDASAGGSDGDGEGVGALVVRTSFSPTLLDEVEQQDAVAALIADPSTQVVASSSAVVTLCAGVALGAPLGFELQWQRDGVVLKADVVDAVPPGAGACLDNAGEPLEPGVYQMVAVGAGELGRATTFTVGASVIDQTFVNNSDVDACEIGLSPVGTNSFEWFVPPEGALAPGGQIVLTVAGVPHDVQVISCDGDELDAVVFDPDGDRQQDLSL